MNGDDLLRLAGNLVANTALGDPEARFRSSVSRAYYGAFHWALHVLGELDSPVPENYMAHEIAQRKLHETGNAIAIEAASLLNDLRGDRNEADYKLKKRRFSRIKNAQTCVENASDAISNLKKCLEEPTRTELAGYFSAH